MAARTCHAILALYAHRTRHGSESWIKWPSRMRVWCLLALLDSCHGNLLQRFVLEPQDQRVIFGSGVTLPCRVENKAGALQWTRDDFGLGIDLNLSGYERYSIVGSAQEGDCSLDIRDVIFEDEGRYQVQVSSGLNGEPAIRSRYAQLTVLAVPESPRIIQGAFINATEDQPVDIVCISTGGKPAPEITWVDANQTVIKKIVENKVELMSDGQRYQTRSVLRLTLSKKDHNMTITCRAQNTAGRAYRMANVSIEVTRTQYAPKVVVMLKSDTQNGLIRQGSDAIFICQVDANPPPQIYRWYINNKPVNGNYSEEMIIFNVTQKHNNAEVKCEVSNKIGKRDEKITLHVTYPPVFNVRPQNVEAEIGATVTLHCNVDSQPPPSITWLFHESGQIAEVNWTDPTLNISVTNETAGVSTRLRYLCKASAEGYPDVESEATIFIRGTPQILSNATQFVSSEDNMAVECAFLSIPIPDHITWYFEGSEICTINNPNYATLKETLPDGIVKYNLIIRESQYGVYNCSVTNKYGNTNAAITLKPSNQIGSNQDFLVVPAVYIVITIIIFAFVYFNKCIPKNRNINEKPVTVTAGDVYKKEHDRRASIGDLKAQPEQSDTSFNTSDLQTPLGQSDESFEMLAVTGAQSPPHPHSRSQRTSLTRSTDTGLSLSTDKTGEKYDVSAKVNHNIRNREAQGNTNLKAFKLIIARTARTRIPMLPWSRSIGTTTRGDRLDLDRGFPTKYKLSGTGGDKDRTGDLFNE